MDRSGVLKIEDVLPYITDSNSAGKIQYDITNAKVKLYNSVLNFNNAPIYITLQYTKTAT